MKVVKVAHIVCKRREMAGRCLIWCDDVLAFSFCDDAAADPNLRVSMLCSATKPSTGGIVRRTTIGAHAPNVAAKETR